MTSATKSPETALQVPGAGKKSNPRSGLAGQVRNTFKDIISILKGLYYGAERAPGPAIIRKPEDVKKTPEYWKDWRWQVRHVVRDIRTFEQVLGITFDPAERERLEETIRKFPLRITPYYLSLIDVNDYKNDPIFKQAFPSPKELIVEQYELADPLAAAQLEQRTAAGIKEGEGVALGNIIANRTLERGVNVDSTAVRFFPWGMADAATIDVGCDVAGHRQVNLLPTGAVEVEDGLLPFARLDRDDGAFHAFGARAGIDDERDAAAEFLHHGGGGSR